MASPRGIGMTTQRRPSGCQRAVMSALTLAAAMLGAWAVLMLLA